MIQSSLESAIDWVQKTIKRKVLRSQLTQQQFDALVSFVYNRGPQYSSRVLELADQGDFVGVSAYMSRVVYGTIIDKKTGKRIKKVLPGLVVRRAYETQPFKGVKK
jgi:lysozyme